MKKFICSVSGAIGSFLINAIGGWDSSLHTLIVFMVIDYLTGIAVAAVFKNSSKTETGRLESNEGFKGICKKCMILMFVLIGYRIDVVLNLDYIRTAVIIAFITNELISIVENAGLMGIPIPKIISNCIDILNKKSIEDGVE